MAGGLWQAMETIERLGREQGAFRRRDLKREGLSGAWVDHLRLWATTQLAPGLYGRPEAQVSALVLACVRVPKGVLTLTSAMFVHGVLKKAPEEVWIAIGRRDHRPRGADARLRFVRSSERLHALDVQPQQVDGYPVRVHSLARTFVESIRHRARFDEAWLAAAWAPMFRKRVLTRRDIEALARERHVHAPVRRFFARHPLVERPHPVDEPPDDGRPRRAR